MDHYIRPLVEYRKLIAAVTALAVLAGIAFWFITPSSYEATTSVLLKPISADPLAQLESDATTAVDLPTELRIATSSAVTDLIVDDLASQSISMSNAEVARRLSAASPKNTKILEVTFEASTPELARVGANTAARNYLIYRAGIAADNRSAAVEALNGRIALLKENLAQVETDLNRAVPDSQPFVALSVERDSLLAELTAQQDALAALSTLSVDAGEILDPAALPTRPAGLDLLTIVVGALLAGLILGAITAMLISAVKASNAPRNRRATDRLEYNRRRDDRAAAFGRRAGDRIAEPPPESAVERLARVTADREQAMVHPAMQATSARQPDDTAVTIESTGDESTRDESPTGDESPGPESTGDESTRDESPTGDESPGPETTGEESPGTELTDNESPGTETTDEDLWAAILPGGLHPDGSTADPEDENSAGMPANPDWVQVQPVPQADAELELPMADDVSPIAGSDTASNPAAVHQEPPPPPPPRFRANPSPPPPPRPEPEPELPAATPEPEANLEPPPPADTSEPEPQPIADTSEPEPEPIADTAEPEPQPIADTSEPEPEPIAVDDDDIPPPPPPPPPPPSQAEPAVPDAGPEPEPIPAAAGISGSELQAEVDHHRLAKAIAGLRPPIALMAVGEMSRAEAVAAAFSFVDALPTDDIDVLIADAILHEPTLSGILQLNESPGLTDVLLGQTELETVVQPVPGLDRVHAVSAGRANNLAKSALSTQMVRRFLRLAKRQYAITLLVAGDLDDAAMITRAGDDLDGILVSTPDPVGQQPADAVAVRLRALPAPIWTRVSTSGINAVAARGETAATV